MIDDEGGLDGVFFVEVLGKLTSEPQANHRTRSDWAVLARWLGSDGLPLSQEQKDRVRAAWRAYVAIGLAPSFRLQLTFDALGARYLEQNPDCKSDKPSTEIMDVFDRMLANDSEIAAKRASDVEIEKAKLKPLLEALASTRRKTIPVGWWRRRSLNSRRWLFGSVSWAVVVYGYYTIWDPFERGSWQGYSDSELYRIVIEIGAPFGLWLLKSIYDKYVA